jgi:CspA family cold shock protein
MTGRVKMFNEQRGFGFVTPDGGGADVFVHRSAIVGSDQNTALQRGDRIEFEVVAGPKGPQASNVRVIGN